MVILKPTKDKAIRAFVIVFFPLILTSLFYEAYSDDEGYKEGINNVFQGLHFNVYMRGEIVHLGQVTNELILCLAEAKRMRNFGSYENDIHNLIWFENGYGMHLYRLNGEIYRFSFIRQGDGFFYNISDAYRVSCDESVLGVEGIGSIESL